MARIPGRTVQYDDLGRNKRMECKVQGKSVVPAYDRGKEVKFHIFEQGLGGKFRIIDRGLGGEGGQNKLCFCLFLST